MYPVEFAHKKRLVKQAFFCYNLIYSIFASIFRFYYMYILFLDAYFIIFEIK